MITGKTIALTRRTFVGKVMSLLFNMLSRLVITFLPRSKCLLISWLQSPSAVILYRKEYVKAVYCHSAILTFMQNTSCKMLGWMKHKLKSLRYTDNTTLIGRKWRRTKEPLDEGERGEWKSWLKTQNKKTKIMASGPLTSWQIDGETMETVRDFIILGSKRNCRWWLQSWN